MFNVRTAERLSLKKECYPEENILYIICIYIYIFTILAYLVFVFIFPNKRHVAEGKNQTKTTLLVQHVNLCVEKMDDRGIFTAQLLWFGPGYC